MKQSIAIFKGHYAFLLQEVLESIDDTVVALNHQKEVVYANAAAYETFGREILTLPISDLVPKSERGKLDCCFNQLEDSKFHSIELQGEREFVGLRDDTLHTFFAEGKLAKIQGEPAYLLVLRDITWKKALESELEKALLHLHNVGRKMKERLEHPSIMDEFPVD
jgi:PAS domain S-box-containing protein